MPLIVLFALICIIAIVYFNFGRPSEIAEIDRDVDTGSEKILAAGDIAATTVGTNVKATFTASTGEVHIYSTNASSPGTITNSGTNSLNTFWNKCGYDDIKIITFDNTVYAPANSSYLFIYGTSSSTNHYALSNLTTINNLGNLDTSKVTNMSHMFDSCSSLKSVDVSKWDTSSVTTMEYMFRSCSSLSTIDVRKIKYE